MQIYPAIDLQRGECVRLTKGDFNQATVYQTNPLIQAQYFIDQGATWLQVVDLDGARDPQDQQLLMIRKLIEKTPLAIQTGGGIRAENDVRVRLEAGVSRVVIGSLAVHKPEEVKKIIKRHHPDNIVLAFDVIVQDDIPMVATDGWQQTSEQTVHELLEYYVECGLKHILCTDILCDNTLLGPNFSLYESILNDYPHLSIQAAGGINSIDDLIRLKALGLDGVIVSKALYENRFTLEEALAC